MINYPCAYCKAGTNEPCTADGKPLKRPHKSRIADAAMQARADESLRRRNQAMYEQDQPPGREKEGVWHACHILQGEAVLRQWILGYGYDVYFGWGMSARVREHLPSGRFYWAVDSFGPSPFDEGYCDSRSEAWDTARAALEECWPDEIRALEEAREARMARFRDDY